MSQCRAQAILPVVGLSDLTGKEGYAVELDSAGKCSLINSAADLPFGVLTEADTTSGINSVAIAAGGLAGTIRVKLGATPGTVRAGTLLQVESGGTFIADAGSGARVVMAQALEAGAADQLIEAALFLPQARS